MKYTILLIGCYILISSMSVRSQDAHYTNYRAVSNFFNPAQTGDFEGNLKVQMGIRTQYQRVYENGLLGGELNIYSPLNKKHWIGAGINLQYDKTGTLSLKTIGFGGNVAYHIPLDKKLRTIISIGAGLDRFNLTADPISYRSELTIQGQPDPDRQIIDDFKSNVLSFNFGVHLKTRINKNNIIRTGISVTHLNAPSYTIIQANQPAQLGGRVNLNTSLQTSLSKILTLEPAIYISLSEKQSNINLQMMSEWKIVTSGNWKGIFGISHRLDESFDCTLGYKTDKLYLHCSFDILTSQAGDLLSNPGAIEVGGYYIISKNHRPTLKPIIFCPRL